MSAKMILLGLGVALANAGKSLVDFAESYCEEDGGQSALDAVSGAIIDSPQITAGQVVNAELDADGLPWHPDIHASTKTKTEKNLWTKKKGVQDSTRDAVIAELRKTYPAPQASAAGVTIGATVTAPPVVAGIQVPVVNAAPQTPYQQLVDWLAKWTGPDKQLTNEWATGVLTSNGTTIAALATNQELSAEFLKAFKQAAGSIGLAEAAA